MVSAEDRRVHPVSFVTNGPVLREGKTMQQWIKAPVSERCRTVWRKAISSRVSLRADEEEVSHPMEINLRWRDRVAVFAQICPEKTLDSLLEALQKNVKFGPRKDEGLEALYTFANFSVWQVNGHFFGRRMDLGQFESFRRVMITKPYEIVVNHDHREVLSALRLAANTYHSRITFVNDDSFGSKPMTFHFTMTKTRLGQYDTWMVDSMLPDEDSLN
ncbi:hypothetical protein NDN08_004024 [Rhodosorus marinus]|uniref:Uncharacterized protein n=1 Tax=Rhodosorus marinus TaxID=101924 RepID=A0AAV8UH48_9RHOD|nr:hypothetical protein NDN08_004024 [Rhodosorus marinus]